MGTEFDCSIRPLADSQSRKEFPCCGLDERGSKKKTEIRMPEESVDDPTDECCLESVRRKMQMQEDMFRKQVRELHRLYGMQKKLIGEMKKDMRQNGVPSPTKSPNANSGYTFHLHRLNDDRGSLDRSASSSGEEDTRIPMGLELEIRPSKGNDSIIDGGLPAKGEVNSINDGLDEESDVELTLSLGI